MKIEIFITRFLGWKLDLLCPSASAAKLPTASCHWQASARSKDVAWVASSLPQFASLPGWSCSLHIWDQLRMVDYKSRNENHLSTGIYTPEKLIHPNTSNQTNAQVIEQTDAEATKKLTNTNTHTHTLPYIYIYIYWCWTAGCGTTSDPS